MDSVGAGIVGKSKLLDFTTNAGYGKIPLIHSVFLSNKKSPA